MSIFNDIYQMSDFTKLELDSVLPNRLTMTFTKWAWVSFYRIGLDFVLPNGHIVYQMGENTIYQMGICFTKWDWIHFTKWV